MWDFNPEVPLTVGLGELYVQSLLQCSLLEKLLFLYRALKAFAVKAVVMCTYSGMVLSYFSAEITAVLAGWRGTNILPTWLLF